MLDGVQHQMASKVAAIEKRLADRFDSQFAAVEKRLSGCEVQQHHMDSCSLQSKLIYMCRVSSTVGRCKCEEEHRRAKEGAEGYQRARQQAKRRGKHAISFPGDVYADDVYCIMQVQGIVGNIMKLQATIENMNAATEQLKGEQQKMKGEIVSMPFSLLNASMWFNWISSDVLHVSLYPLYDTHACL